MNIMNKKLLKQINIIPGWLSDKEALFLTHLVKKTQKYKGEIVEIGSFHGKSTICLAQGKGKIYAIDPHQGYVESDKKYDPTYKAFMKTIKSVQTAGKIIPVVKTSREASRKWKGKIRFLFIDALHDEKNAALDYKLWSKYLVDNGVIAIHDSFLRWCGSEKVAIEKIVNSADYYKIGTTGSIIYGVKGKGNALDKIRKSLWRVYILSHVNLNHLKIIIFDLPNIIKTRFFPKYKIVL